MKFQQIARLVVVGCLLILPGPAWAQVASATIAGVVKDASGAVMPGVTVEASSPALIEKVRNVVTDEQGQYKIVNLVPGSYTVSFTLPGFSTFKREGLELATSFTATVNAEMKVGALEETITVSGQAPVVDTQNVQQQTTIARGTLDAIPTTKRLGQYATIIPGAT
jgi:Carboxypeptidase regulatory-like domain